MLVVHNKLELNFEMSSILNINEILIDNLPKKQNKKNSLVTIYFALLKIMNRDLDLMDYILGLQGRENTLEHYIKYVSDDIKNYDDDKIILTLSVYIVMNYIEEMKMIDAFYNNIELKL